MIYKTLSLLIVFTHFLGINTCHAQCACDHLADIQLKLKTVVQQADVDGWYVPWNLLEQQIQLEKTCGLTNSIFSELVRKYPRAFESKSTNQIKIKNILAGMLEAIEEGKNCLSFYNEQNVQIDVICPTVAYKSTLDELATVVSHCFHLELEETELVSVQY